MRIRSENALLEFARQLEEKLSPRTLGSVFQYSAAEVSVWIDGMRKINSTAMS